MAEPDFLHNDRRITRVEEQIKLINERLSRIETRLIGIETQMARLETRVNVMFAVMLALQTIIIGRLFFG